MKSIFKILFGKKEGIEKTNKLFFIEISKITKKEDNKSGFIGNIETEKGSRFLEIDLSDSPEIESMKRGVSRVVQNLKLTYRNPGALYQILQDIKEINKNVSILHIDTKDK